MEVRVARHTDPLPELVAFYRDGLGLLDLGGFEDHAGYSGVFLQVAGTACHLEFTTGGAHDPPVPHPESLLVLYLHTAARVEAAIERTGATTQPSANPYWDGIGARTLLDPDGFRVVLVPGAWDTGSSGPVGP